MVALSSPSLSGRRLALAPVMLVYHFLDRDRAGHGGLGAEERGGGTQGEARHMPDGLERRGAHSPVAQQAVEGREMPAFLLDHMLHRAAVGAMLQHRELAFVDAPGAIFAGLVDADDALDQLLGREIAGQAPAGLGSSRTPQGRRQAEEAQQPGIDEIVARHGDGEHRPGRPVAGDHGGVHELLLQIGHRLVDIQIAAAARQPLPPMLLDPDMEQRQPRHHQQSEGGQHGTPKLQPPGQGQRDEAERNRPAIAIALPDAEGAGLEPADYWLAKATSNGAIDPTSRRIGRERGAWALVMESCVMGLRHSGGAGSRPATET